MLSCILVSIVIVWPNSRFLNSEINVFDGEAHRDTDMAFWNHITSAVLISTVISSTSAFSTFKQFLVIYTSHRKIRQTYDTSIPRLPGRPSCLALSALDVVLRISACLE